LAQPSLSPAFQPGSVKEATPVPLYTGLSVRTPFACVVAEINTPLETTPFKINRSPYMNWLVRLEPDDLAQARSVLMSGNAVAVRANELMDLHGMTSLVEFQRPIGSS
jgi:hypothetical protein